MKKTKPYVAKPYDFSWQSPDTFRGALGGKFDYISIGSNAIHEGAFPWEITGKPYPRPHNMLAWRPKD